MACPRLRTPRPRLGPHPARICSANLRGSRAAFEEALGLRADVLLLQEHKLPASALPSWISQAKSLGWVGCWQPCADGPKGGRSGGLAILVRHHIPVFAVDYRQQHPCCLGVHSLD